MATRLAASKYFVNSAGDIPSAGKQVSGDGMVDAHPRVLLDGQLDRLCRHDDMARHFGHSPEHVFQPGAMIIDEGNREMQHDAGVPVTVGNARGAAVAD